MENAADALKMAGAILIFVLALSVIILFFSQVRATSDTIISYKDRETAYIDLDYYVKSSDMSIAPNEGVNQPARIVGIETILQTITRAYIENYKILFYDSSNDPMVIYTLKNGTEINYIDLEAKQENDSSKINNVVLGNDEQKKEFLTGILYNQFDVSKNRFEDKYSLKLNYSTNGFFDEIKGKKFYEFFGIYYQNDSSNIPDIMKNEKRIITYKETT